MTTIRFSFPRHNAYYIIVPDPMSGKPRRYTTYRLPGRASGRVRIVGRELTLAHSHSNALDHALKRGPAWGRKVKS